MSKESCNSQEEQREGPLIKAGPIVDCEDDSSSREKNEVDGGSFLGSFRRLLFGFNVVPVISAVNDCFHLSCPLDLIAFSIGHGVADNDDNTAACHAFCCPLLLLWSMIPFTHRRR